MSTNDINDILINHDSFCHTDLEANDLDSNIFATRASSAIKYTSLKPDGGSALSHSSADLGPAPNDVYRANEDVNGSEKRFEPVLLTITDEPHHLMRSQKSNVSSIEAHRSRASQNREETPSSTLAQASRSFTNSDSALPLSYVGACKVPRAPSLPLSSTSRCSMSSDAKTTPPAVPPRTTSSPQKRASKEAPLRLIGLRGQLFIGREWVFEKICQWITLSKSPTSASEPTKQRNDETRNTIESACSMILMGGPGTGKTAIYERIIEAKKVLDCESEKLTPEHSGVLFPNCQLLAENLLAHHACSSQFVASLNLPRLILSFRDQIMERDDTVGDFYRRKLSENGGRLNRLFTSARLCTFPDEVLFEGVLKPLADLDPTILHGKKLFILVDAVDECLRLNQTSEVRVPPGLMGVRCLHKRSSQISSGSERTDPQLEQLSADLQNCSTLEQGWVSLNVLELLAVSHLFLPPWIGILATCRREHHSLIRRLFPCSASIVIDDLHCPFVTRDLGGYVFERLKSELVLQATFTANELGQEALQMLQVKSNASLLYLQIVLNAVAQCWLTPDFIKCIPGTLSGLFLWLCQRLLSPLVDGYTPMLMAVKPILSLILASPRPLTLLEVDNILQVNSLNTSGRDVWKHILSLPYFIKHDFPEYLSLQPKQWLRLLDCAELERERVVTFAHSSFRDWLLDVKYSTPVYSCSPREGHTLLALAALHQIRQIPSLSSSFTWDILFNFTRSTLCNSTTALLQITNALKDVELDFAADTLGNLDCWMFIHDPILVHCSFAGSSISQLLEDALNYEHRQHRTATPSTDTKSVLRKAAATPAGGRSGGGMAPQHKVIASGKQKNTVAAVAPVLMTSSDKISLIGQLCTAAFQGKLEVVRAILKNEQVDIEMRDAAGSTPLVLASRQGHTAIVRELLLANARLDQVDQDGWSALRSAAWGGHKDVVKLLLEAGVNVDITGPDCRTALRAAAWAGHTEVVQCLLEAGANVNQADAEGRTPLIAAAYMGCIQVIEILADAGADLNHADQDGRTALCVAAFCVPPSEAHTEVVASLLQLGADPNLGDRENVTPLIGAAQSGRRRICELCLEADADVDRVDRSGRSALVTAVVNGHVEVVQLLLFWGAAVHTIDANGRSVLSIAAACGHTEVVRELLARGLDEAHRDHMGATPLHLAAAAGHDEVVRLLLDAGSRPDEVDNTGQTPLLVACQADHVRVIRLLLKPALSLEEEHNSASAGAATGSATPCHSAGQLLDELTDDKSTQENLSSEFNGHDFLARSSLDTINRAAMDGRSPLRAAALNNNIALVQTLLALGADPDQQDTCGRTTLGVVVLQGLLQMAKTLLRYPPQGRPHNGTHLRGANPRLTDDEGRCPLHIAAWQGHSELVALLLQAGTPVDVRDKEDRTPLHSAAWQNHAAVCRLLLKAGADVNAVCSQGATALCIAAQEGHLENGANASQVDIYGRPPFKVALKAGHRNICALLERYGGRTPSAGSPRIRQRRKPAASQAPSQQPPPLLTTDADRAAPGGLAPVQKAPAQSRNMARLSFEHTTASSTAAGVETGVNSATFVMNKSRQGLSPLRVVAPQAIEASGAYAKPSIVMGGGGFDQSMDMARNMHLKCWPVFPGPHGLVSVSPTWCSFPTQAVVGAETQPLMHPQHPLQQQQQQPQPTPNQTVFTAYSAAWQPPMVFANSRAYDLQPTYVLSSQGFLVPQHPGVGPFQPYFLQQAPFLSPSAITSTQMPCFPSPLIMPPCGNNPVTNPPPRQASRSMEAAEAVQCLSRAHLPTAEATNRAAPRFPVPVATATRTPDTGAAAADTSNTYCSSALQTPPQSLEPGQHVLSSPILNDCMTYYTASTVGPSFLPPPAPHGPPPAGAFVPSALSRDQHALVNTKLGEDAITLNEVTDSEYEASVWVSRRGVGDALTNPVTAPEANGGLAKRLQSSDRPSPRSPTAEQPLKEATAASASTKKIRQFGLNTGKRKTGLATAAATTSGAVVDESKSMSKSGRSKGGSEEQKVTAGTSAVPSSSSSSKHTSALLPKFSSPGHGGSSGLKMRNVLQEAWKGARRRAFEKSSSSTVAAAAAATAAAASPSSTGGVSGYTAEAIKPPETKPTPVKHEAEAYV
ncbi:hypothetical protein AAHC03_09272 [Spirometra sp. Aus1]